MLSSTSDHSSTPAAEKLQVLKNSALFRKFTPAALSRLCKYVTTRRYKRDNIIFSRGDPGQCLFIVASGTVKISVQSEDSKDAVFNVINACGIFGEIALPTASRVRLTPSRSRIVNCWSWSAATSCL